MLESCVNKTFNNIQDLFIFLIKNSRDISVYHNKVYQIRISNKMYQLQRERDEALVYAVSYRSIAVVRRLILVGANPNAVARSKMSLIIALSRSRRAITKFLLRNGASPNVVCPSTHKFPLLIAVEKRDIGMLNALLAAGADINYGTWTTRGTALHQAIRLGYGDMVQYLVERGASVNLANVNSTVPLDVCFNKLRNEGIPKETRLQMMMCLLDHGAEPNLSRCRSRIPCAFFRIGTVEALTALKNRGLSVEVESNSLRHPLIQSIHNDSDDFIKELILNENISVNSRDRNGNTALHEAAQLLNMNRIKLLLSLGAKVNIKNNESHTPLSTIVGPNCVEPCFRHLLMISSKKNIRRTLRFAARQGYLHQTHYMIKFLVLRYFNNESGNQSDLEFYTENASDEITLYMGLCMSEIENMTKIKVVKDLPRYQELKNPSNEADKALIERLQLIENVTYYDILRMHKREYRSVHNDVKTVFRGDYVVHKFGIFGEHVCYSFQNGKRYFKLVKKAKKILSDITHFEIETFDDVLAQILYHLKKRDLESLIKVYS